VIHRQSQYVFTVCASFPTLTFYTQLKYDGYLMMDLLQILLLKFAGKRIPQIGQRLANL